MSPSVSAIVVNHNRAQLLRQSLESLLEQSWPPLEILVVDNASTDGSPEVATSLGDERIRLIQLPSNRGFAGGNNAALGQVRGEFVALLNNDARARPDWIEQMVRALEPEPALGMCASKILFRGTDVIDKAGHLIFPDGQNRGRGTGERDRGQYQQVEEALFPDGCAALYRSCMLRELQGFDESFFAYGDDADLGLRAQWRGWKCLYVPQAVVEHRHSCTLGRFAAQKVYWIERNRFWLALKNFPWPLLAVSPVFTLYRWSWNLAAALAGRGAAGEFRRRASLGALLTVLARAYRDGLLGAGEMLAKRARIRRRRRLTDVEFYRLLGRFRVSARVLALGEAELEDW